MDSANDNAMLLAHDIQGSGPPLVILHGLFGASDNWSSRAAQYAERFQTVSMDLRNHGNSPHSDLMSYPVMAADVFATLDHRQLDRVTLLGHSMGGKVAMRMALDAAERVERLIVVDIAPRAYPPTHSDIISALQQLDVGKLGSRREADRQLQDRLPDSGLRAFLLKNLRRDADGSYSWRMNLAAIAACYPDLLAALSDTGAAYPGPTLFIKGADSDYLSPADTDPVKRLFTEVQAKVVANAGHWPHAERPALFDRILNEFLDKPN